MADGILVRVVGVQNYARHVVQTKIVFVASFDIAESNREPGFDRKIPIVDFIRISEKDVVVVNPPNGQPKTVVKATRFPSM